MRKTFLLLLATVWVVLTAGAQGAPSVFYVAPQGDDAGPGTLAHPFASVQRALDTVGPGDTIRLADGCYRLDQPLMLKGASGVILEACEGARPVLSGSVPVGEWKRVRDGRILAKVAPDARRRLYVTDLPKQGITDFGDPVKDRRRPQLFCAGVAQTLARYPNEGFVYGDRALGATPIPPVENGNSGTVEGIFSYTDPQLDRWAGEKAPWVGGYWFYDWTDAYKPLTRIDPQQRVMEVPGKHFRHGLRFFGLNLLCEIDAPGEWYLDRDAGRLYWYAPEGVDPAHTETALSMLQAKFMLTLEDCAGVTVRGLSFCESRGGALKVKDGRDVCVLDCRMENLGSEALRVDGGEGCRIDGCVLRHLEASGITMRGGDRAALVPAGHLCTNTLVEDYERFHRTYNGAFTAEGCGIALTHCVLRGGPSSALSLAGNDLVAEYNLIDRVATESDDQGGFDLYLNPSMRGIELRWNHWRDIHGGTRYGVGGIRLDDLISGVKIYGNVFERCGSIEFGGVQIHGGSDNVIEDNLFYDCPYAVSFTPYGDSLWHATWDRIRERICREVDMTSEAFLRRYPEARQWGSSIDVNVVRNNLLVDCGALFFHDTVPQITGGNVSVASEGRGIEAFCALEILLPLGIRAIPLEQMGILKNKWLNDE